jgi:hypothetical protein
VLSRKGVVKSGDVLGPCNINPSKMAFDLQRIFLSVDGHEPVFTGLQAGRITADCLECLKTDAKRRRFFIENMNWYLVLASLIVIGYASDSAS